MMIFAMDLAMISMEFAKVISATLPSRAALKARAAALKKPCVALFGATDPVLTGPYGPGLHVVFRSGCPKSPCFKKQCPLQGVKCNGWTDAEKVADELLAALERNRTSATSMK